jgi:hypothetical protein
MVRNEPWVVFPAPHEVRSERTVMRSEHGASALVPREMRNEFSSRAPREVRRDQTAVRSEPGVSSPSLARLELKGRRACP